MLKSSNIVLHQSKVILLPYLAIMFVIEIGILFGLKKK